MSFHDVLLPQLYSYSTKPGIGYRTMIYRPDNQIVSVKQEQEFSEGAWELNFNVRDRTKIQELYSFYLCRFGSLYSFKFKDLENFSTNENVLPPILTAPGALAPTLVIDGELYLARQYGTEVKRVYAIDPANFVFTVNGSLFTPTIEAGTGRLISPTYSPGSLYKWSGIFYERVRFDSELDLTHDQNDFGDLAVRVVEDPA